MVKIVKSDYRVVAGYLADMPKWKRNSVNEYISQAMGYVWGWQDAGGRYPPLDGNHDSAWQFACWYGVQVAQYKAEAKSSLRPVRALWLDWRADRALEQAREIGREDGAKAASWLFDGNTSPETYAAFAKGLGDGDPEYLDRLPAPDLSGEWSDTYSYQELLAEVRAEDLDMGHQIASAYEDAYHDAVQAEVDRVLTVQLGETP